MVRSAAAWSPSWTAPEVLRSVAQAVQVELLSGLTAPESERLAGLLDKALASDLRWPNDLGSPGLSGPDSTPVEGMLSRVA